MLSLNRAFSAPIKLASNLTDNDLLFLMAHDSDSFNRWEAGQTMRPQADHGGNAGAGPGGGRCPTRRACRRPWRLARRPELEPAFVALLLSPPGKATLPARSAAMSTRSACIGRANAPKRERAILGAAARGVAARLSPIATYSPDPLNARAAGAAPWRSRAAGVRGRCRRGGDRWRSSILRRAAQHDRSRRGACRC